MQSSPVFLQLGMLALVGLAAATDLASRRIPNKLLVAGLLAAGVLHLCNVAPASALLSGLLGAATGLFVFLPLYCARGMAAGDVKLLAVVGAFATPLEVLQIALYSVCLGGLIALIAVIARGRLRPLLANLACLLRPLLMRIAGMPAVAEPLPAASVGNIPYGVAIALGTALVVAQHHVPAGTFPPLL
jgi:prepilin peptidase CpaA